MASFFARAASYFAAASAYSPRLRWTSPLIAVARISTSGPSPSDAASLTSSSEVVSPLIERASMKTFDPRLTPISMSPEADCSATWPVETLPTSWSPDAV